MADERNKKISGTLFSDSPNFAKQGFFRLSQTAPPAHHRAGDPDDVQKRFRDRGNSKTIYVCCVAIGLISRTANRPFPRIGDAGNGPFIDAQVTTRCRSLLAKSFRRKGRFARRVACADTRHASTPYARLRDFARRYEKNTP